jgi:cytochrome P450
VEVDLDSVDLADPEFYATGDPHAVWKILRDGAPVYRQTLPDGRSFLSVTRYHDACAVMRDYTRFTSRRGTLLSILGSPDPAQDLMMAASDPPVHTAMREPMAKLLSFAEMKARRPAIRQVVLRLLAPLAEESPWDLADACSVFPMAITGALMGIPEEDWPYLARLTTLAIAPGETVSAQRPGQSSLASVHHELFEYFAEQVREAKSQENLIGQLVRLPVSDRTMRPEEVVYNCYSLLLGANVTTPHTIAATVLAFIENPDEYRRISSDSHSISAAVEEGLRWSSPANHLLRYAVSDTELSGVQIRAGEAVVAWPGAANRDERVFADPYRFDVTRSPNRHLAFGFGPHYCIGAPLARIALRSLLHEMVGTIESFELAGPVEHLRSNFAAGIKHMPVTAQLRQGAKELLKT